MTNKSTLMNALSSWADSRALKIRSFDSVANQLDKDFEMTVENDTPVIIRKSTKQVLPDNLDAFAKLVLRQHIDDRSFGSFRSAFKPRPTTSDEQSKVQALLDSTRMHFTDKDRAASIQQFVRNNFVHDGNSLRRFSSGMVSTKSYTPDEVLLHYGREVIDGDRSELNRLEELAELRDKANWLAGGEAKTADRLLATLRKVNTTAFETIPADLIQKQSADLEAKAMSHIGILDKAQATLAELNQIQIKQKQFFSQIDELPVFNQE